MSLKTLVGSGIQKKKFGSGSGINHSGSATLLFFTTFADQEVDPILFADMFATPSKKLSYATTRTGGPNNKTASIQLSKNTILILNRYRN